MAEGVRGVEKGLSAFFNLMNGTALVALGLSVVAGGTYRPWSGRIAILAGIGFVAGGLSTAITGFSMQAATILQPSLLLLAVFLVGTYVSVWRKRDCRLRNGS